MLGDPATLQVLPGLIGGRVDEDERGGAPGQGAANGDDVAASSTRAAHGASIGQLAGEREAARRREEKG